MNDRAQKPSWGTRVADAVAVVWLGLAAGVVVTVVDVVVDGLFRPGPSVLFSASIAAAFGACALGIPATVLAIALHAPLARIHAQRPTLLRGACLFAALAMHATALPFLLLYYALPDPPVHLWREYLRIAVLVGPTLAALMTWVVASRFPTSRTSGVLLALSVAALMYFLGAIVPRDLHFQVSLGCALGLAGALILAFASGVAFGPPERRGRLAVLGAVAVGWLLISGAGHAWRWRNSLFHRDLTARGSELLKGSAALSRRVLFPEPLLATLVAQGRAEGPPPSKHPAVMALPKPPRGIVLVTVDALRFDALQTHGLTTFERLRSESLEFSHFAASSSATDLSLQAMFFGHTRPDPDCGHSIVDVLGRAGVRTVLVPIVSMTCEWSDLGADVLADLRERAADPGSTGLVLSTLADEIPDAPTPFFAWAHLLDPHLPYAAPGANSWERYLGEVGHVDAALKEFTAVLSRRGLLQDTLLIVSADHGEEHFEHAGRSHSRTLYEEVLHVPLLFRFPGSAGGQTSTRRASGVDIAPTILQLMRADQPSGFAPEGASVFDTVAPEWRFAQLGSSLALLQSVEFAGWKLIANYRYASAELYNLRDDPDERDNRIDSDSGVAARLGGLLDRFVRRRRR